MTPSDVERYGHDATTAMKKEALAGSRAIARRRSLMFAYFGRQGALSQLTLELANLAVSRPEEAFTFAVSAQNELMDQFAILRDHVLAVEMFERRRQALRIGGIVAARRALRDRIESDGTNAFVSLMSHVWSPWMVPVIRRAGIKHIVVVHDVKRHPGDFDGLLNRWLLCEARAADHVITLSHAVARQLAARGMPANKIRVLFHPDLSYGRGARRREPRDGPLRVLFFGRIRRYKGLDLLVSAIESLRAAGVAATLGVYGEGEIGAATRARLSALGAEVENRWLEHSEFESILLRHDLVVASHIEASQSGVVAAAFAAGLPVVATPVGGLVEQIAHEVTGLVAESVTAAALAAAVRRLADDRLLLSRLQRGVAAGRGQRSMELFLDNICEVARCTS